MNDYLDPPVSPQNQADILTRAGFPLEQSENVQLPDSTTDVRHDFELTFNRGDCLCHIGLAREIAALSGGKLTVPQPVIKASGPSTSNVISVTNREPDLCPLYTARVIRGVKVGPSPKWLANRLLARGDIPRNNIVDASNFVLFEFGQPTHVFDLAKLQGPQIVVRRAQSGERFLPIGEDATELALSTDDLVIADAQRAVAIAGVKGGALTAVTNHTTDIVIEAATFAPVPVRHSSRRHHVASDSSYRFERGVHAGQIEPAANRLVELILQLCGGTLCEGMVADGKPIPPRRQGSMRCERCRAIMGVPMRDEQMVQMLARLGFEPIQRGTTIECTVPYARLDVECEIDLIEEVGRMFGYDNLPIDETIQVRVAPPQPTELARRAVHDALVGMGYVETVTHSLMSENAAAAFLPPGMQLLKAHTERTRAESVLRPSIIPSLLRVLALNRDAGVNDVKLFESGATFAMLDNAKLERVNLTFLHTAESPESGMRQARGVIDRLVQLVLGDIAKNEIEPNSSMPWFMPGAGAVLRVEGVVLGTFGQLAPDVAGLFDLHEPLYATEIGLPEHYHRFPAETEVRSLPSFPSIERDVSAIIDERLQWAEVKLALEALQLQHLEAIEFIATFRGKPIGSAKKSLTLRARFRAADRTLKHDEVDSQMHSLMSALESRFGAEIRK